MTDKLAFAARLVLSAAFVFGATHATPSLASAQGPVLIQLPQPSQPLYDGRSRLTAARFSNGEIVTAQQTPIPNIDGRPASHLEIVRYSASGREIQRLPGDSGHGFASRDELSKIIPLPDGGAVISGRAKASEPATPYLFRLTRDGRVAWRVAGRANGNEDYFAGWTVDRGSDGSLFVHGYFRGGSFQLPGSRTWRPRRRYNPFMARIDPTTGEILWAKLIPRDGEGLVHDGMFSLLRTDVRTSRGGDPASTFSELRVDHYDLAGRRRGSWRDRLPGAVAIRGAVLPIRDGGLAITTETCRRQDAAQRCLTEGIVYVYDVRGRRLATHDAPAWSVMARPSPGAPMRVIGPSALRRIVLRNGEAVVADEVDVLTFEDPIAAPVRARISIPRMRFTSVVDSILFGGVSTPDGVFVYSPSALLEEGTLDRGVAGDTLFFIPNSDFRPVDRLPEVVSDPYLLVPQQLGQSTSIGVRTRVSDRETSVPSFTVRVLQ